MTRALAPRSIALAARRHGGAASTERAAWGAGPAWLGGAAASAGAGLIHLALGPAHIEALGTLGLDFALAATLQLGWAAVAVVVALRARRAFDRRQLNVLAASGIAINAAILVAWVVSRVVGLPAGRAAWTPEAIGVADAIAALFEAGLVGWLALGLVVAVRDRSPSGRIPRSIMAPATVTTLVIALVAVGTITAVSAGGHARPDHHDANAAAPDNGHEAEPAHGHPAEPGAEEPAHAHSLTH